MDVASLRIAINTGDVKKANDELDKLSKTSNKTEQSTKRLSKSFGGLSTAVAVIGAGVLAKQFIETADAMNLLNARLRLVTSSMEEYKKQQIALLEVAKGSYSSLSDTVSLYTKLDPALKRVGATTEGVNQVVDSFAKGLKLGGATASESSSAILQFGQAMGSGVLRGDEFNSMMEASPKLMAYVAEGMNKPVTSLRKLAEEGKLTAGEVSAAMLLMSDKIEADFKTLPKTVGGAITNLQTDISLLVNEIDTANQITATLANLLSDTSGSLNSSSDTFLALGSAVSQTSLDIVEISKEVWELLSTFNEISSSGAGLSLFEVGLTGLRVALDTVYVGLHNSIVMAKELVNASKNLFSGKDTDFLASVNKQILTMDDLVNRYSSSLEKSTQKQAKSNEATKESELDKKAEARAILTKAEALRKEEEAEKKKDKIAKEAAKSKEELNRDLLQSERDLTLNALSEFEKRRKELDFDYEDDIKKYQNVKGAKEALDKEYSNKRLIIEEDEKKKLTEINEKLLEDIAKQQADSALKFYAIVQSETDRINENYKEMYEANKGFFDDSEMATFFTKWQESIDGIKGGYDEINDLVSDYGASSKDWTAGLTGQSKAVASISNAFADMESDQQKYKKISEKIQKSALTDEQKSVKLKELETKHLGNQTLAYGNLAGSMASFFGEGSKEAAAFQLVQTTLATISAVTAILEQGKGDPYSAFPRMAAMAAAVIPLVASIGGTIKAFGGGGSTSTSSDAFSAMAANEGTGSVLGDAAAQSKSMANSLELLSDLAKPEFALTSQMAKSLQSIDAKIGGVTNLLLREGGYAFGAGFEGFDTGYKNTTAGLEKVFNSVTSTMVDVLTLGLDKKLLGGAISGLFGGIVSSVLGGLFGKTSVSTAMTDSGITFADALLVNAKEQFDGSAYQTIQTTVKKKSWFSSSTRTSLNTYFVALDDEVERQFSLVLSGLYDTTVLAGQALNKSSLEIENELSDFVVSIGKISLKGKTGEQIQETLSSIFGKIADDIAKDVFPLLTPFQRVGEGLFETMTRVASGMETARYYIARLGKSFDDVAYTDIENAQGDVSFEALKQSILGLEGVSNGVAQIIQNLNGDVEELYSTYVALDRLRFDLSAIGTATDALTSSMLYGAGGISALSDATQSYIENYLSESEQVAYNTAIMADAFSDLGLTIPTTKQGFTDLLKSIDVTSESGQDLYGRLILLADGFNDLVESSDNVKSSLFDKIQSFIDGLRDAAEAKDATATFATFTEAFNGMVDAIASGTGDLEQIGNVALSSASSYLNSVTANATAQRDIDFAKAMVANKFEGVIATPDTTLSTINDTLLQNNTILANKLDLLKFELNSLKIMTIDQRATSENQLSTMRAILGEVSA